MASLILKGGRVLVGRTSPGSCISRVNWLSTSQIKAKAEPMKQVEVDEKDVQAQLGGSTLAFVKKAEKANAARAAKHVKYRTKDWMILLTCLGIAGGIYGYTMYAMKQEQFLDDFEMPDPLEEDTRIKKH